MNSVVVVATQVLAAMNVVPLHIRPTHCRGVRSIMDNQLREVLVCPLQPPPPVTETAPAPPTSAAGMSAFQPVSAPAQPFLPAQSGFIAHTQQQQQWSTAQQPANAAAQVAPLPANQQQQQQQLGANPLPGALAFPTTLTGQSLPYHTPSTAAGLPLVSPQQAILAPPVPPAHVPGSVAAPGVSPLAFASSVPPSQLQYAVHVAREPQTSYGASYGYPILQANRQQAPSAPYGATLAPSSHTLPSPSMYYHQGASTSMVQPAMVQPSMMAHQATPVMGGVALTQSSFVNRTPAAYPMQHQPNVSPAQAGFASPVSPASPASFSPVARPGQAQLPLHAFTPNSATAMQLAGERWMDPR